MIAARVRAVLTDIEGTTGSIAFVRDVLFPYADTHLRAFVATEGGRPEVRALLDEAAAIAEVDPHDDDAIVGALRAWIAADKKITPLKALQGLIWENGYKRGELRGHVYHDAANALKRWFESGIILAVYSSGSVAAQKLLFGHSIDGDLTPLFSAYFDTTIGAKSDSSSYERIAEALGLDPGDGIFLSDVGAELDAAHFAGWKTAQIVRPGTIGCAHHHRAVDFDQLDLS